jgi:hypothetical protein
MKTHARLLLWLCLVGTSSNTLATEKAPANASREIANLENSWAECFRTGNPEPAKQFIADDFVGTTSKAVRYSKSKAVQDIVESKGQYLSFTAENVTVRVYGNAAVAQGTDVWVMADGKSTKGSSVWTDTWVRVRGKWLLVAAQDAQPDQPSR